MSCMPREECLLTAEVSRKLLEFSRQILLSTELQEWISGHRWTNNNLLEGITKRFCLSRASEGRNSALSTSRRPFFLLLSATNHRILHANHFLWKNSSWCPPPIFKQSEHAKKHARKSSCKLEFDVKNLRKFHRATKCTSSPSLVCKT